MMRTMDRSAYDRFFELERNHFWRIGKRRLVLEWLERYAPVPAPGSDGLRILDIGGACSFIPRELQRFGRVVVLESDKATVELARSQLAVDIRLASFPEQAPSGEEFDVITLLDVLEHIEHDTRALAVARRLLAPKGLLLVTVPALPWLWSDHDVVLHHFRRYTQRDLVQKLEAAEFAVERVSFYTGLLLPLLVLQRGADRLRLAITGRHRTKYDVRAPLGFINVLLGFIITVERLVLRSANIPIGSSLIAVARPR